ncbi:MAG TPA: DnaJ domain-containing protein [Dehalococcoidales bacterium]|nr:DnaJ domain-containing protein [Dehalococcoidales bacterium]
MKDYYQILGISEKADDEEVRKAFRKLAFQYHPDKNLGREKQAEAKFKDINEAYAVLSDKVKRQQYDLARQSGAAGTAFGSQPGFRYSQQDIFKDAFTNRASMDDFNRIFGQAGLRFDPEFLNRVFFNANNVVIRYYTYSNVKPQATSHSGNTFNTQSEIQAQPYRSKPGLMERMAARTTFKLSQFILKRLFGIQMQEPAPELDMERDFEIDAAKAVDGGEQLYIHKNWLKTRKLMVKIPSGIQSGTKIRLQGLGRRKGKRRGDLYLRVTIRPPG